MGGTESSEGRRVSLGKDEEERVRVLQGVRLSENVVNRMKDSSQSSKAGLLTLPLATPPSALGISKGPDEDSTLPRSEGGGGQQSLGVEKDLLKRYKQEQALAQEELFRAAMRDRKEAIRHRSASLHPGEGSVDQENQNAALLNAELYKLSSQQFHEAASKMESTIKPRRLQPVCSELQAQILRCYHDHLHEVLLCSDLVKAYQRCVSAAHKG
ncbi:MICOS complex subunit MIC25 isoform X2 [Saccopteryx bilineata]|uniref:MICOS complex subunit MIC25 isoform X2 n=1 Tax=Saccopteryx bilineata TaxID=59482 RepID=UPI00338F7300